MIIDHHANRHKSISRVKRYNNGFTFEIKYDLWETMQCPNSCAVNIKTKYSFSMDFLKVVVCRINGCLEIQAIST